MNKTVNLIMLVGIPASGKSTLARKLNKENNYAWHSSDNLRDLRVPEKHIFQALHTNILNDLNKDIDCVYDATNLKSWVRRKRVEYIRNNCKNNINVTCIYFKPNIKISLERNNKRPTETYVPYEVIMDMYKGFEIPRSNEGFNKIIEVEVTNNELN